MQRRRIFGWSSIATIAMIGGGISLWMLPRTEADAPTPYPTTTAHPASDAGNLPAGNTARIRLPSESSPPPVFSDGERYARTRTADDSLSQTSNTEKHADTSPKSSSIRIGLAASSDPTGESPAGPTSRGAFEAQAAQTPGRFTEYPVRRASHDVPVTATTAGTGTNPTRSPAPNMLPPPTSPTAMPSPYAPIGAPSAAAQSTVSPSPVAAPTQAAAVQKKPTPSLGGTGRPGEKALEGLQQPTVTIEKAAPPEIQVGKAAIFEIRVRNVGQTTVGEVEVRDLVPQGAQLIDTKPRASVHPNGDVIWNLGTMKPGDETVLQMELLPTTEGDVGSVATLHYSAAASARAMCTRPEIALDVQSPRRVLAGDDVPLRIRISNPGTGVATGIVLTEVVPANMLHEGGNELEYVVGDLQPNEARELDLTLRASKPGQVLNLLHAKGDGKLATEIKTQIEIVAPALAVEVEGPKKRFLDRQATYAVSIANPGTAPAKEVELVTHLPRGLQFVDANNNGEYDPQSHSVRWLLEELPPRERGSVSVTMLPIEPGQQLLRIESSAQRDVSARKEETIVVEAAPAVVFQVVDTTDPIEVGGETTYEVTIANQGSKESTNVQLVVTLPDSMEPVDAAGPTRFGIAGRQVQFSPLPQLLAKNETKYRVRVRCTKPGDHRCHVSLTSDDSRTPVTKEEGTRVYADE